MLAYQNVIGIRNTPVKEVKLGTNGALLAAGEPRYDSLDDYVCQFGAPLSQLRGSGLYSFYDPVMPEVTILVMTEKEEYCRRCGGPLDVCPCPF
jgi:hypothetical protein